jgi:hypothetical protein
MRSRYPVRSGQRFRAELWVLSCGGNSRRKPAQAVAGIGCGLNHSATPKSRQLESFLFNIPEAFERSEGFSRESSGGNNPRNFGKMIQTFQTHQS